MRSVVIYAFHEMNERVEYFFKNAIFQADDVDFVIVCNSQALEFTVPPYADVIRRDNIGYDFGAWSDAVALYNNYDRYLFVNSSVVGPFVPGKWTDIFFDRLNNEVRLFGPTINNNVREPVHVQSYLFCMTRHTLSFLQYCGIFSTTHYESEFEGAVYNREIPMSTAVLQMGWNIGCLLKDYQGVNWRVKPYNVGYLDDIMFPNYRNVYWTDEEMVFIKGNRNPGVFPKWKSA
jgi:hypothetical protein